MTLAEECEVVIIGAGQAGLALSHELTSAGVEHLVLERDRVGEAWRKRWDSFCLVTPNWMVQLPGGAYAGDDPDGYMSKDAVVDHLVDYAAAFGAPVREGVEVLSLEAAANGGFRVTTSDGALHSRAVVVASGGYPKTYRPPAAEQFPGSVHAIDAADYTNPQALPPGDVLVVGSGQTGCQLAEEIFEAGRAVHLSCGRAPWVPRRIEGRDVLSWLFQTPFMEARLADLPGPMARLGANPQASGHGGGHDLHYRTLQAMGVELYGHFAGVEESKVHFAPDLADCVAFGDARYNDLAEMIRHSCAERGTAAPEMPPPPPFAATPSESLDLAGVGVVIFTTGFRPDYSSWVRFPEAFDAMGYPIQVDGSSTVVPDLHFMGIHFQRKRKSAVLYGVGEDATVLAEHIVGAAG